MSNSPLQKITTKKRNPALKNRKQSTTSTLITHNRRRNIMKKIANIITKDDAISETNADTNTSIYRKKSILIGNSIILDPLKIKKVFPYIMVKNISTLIKRLMED